MREYITLELELIECIIQKKQVYRKKTHTLSGAAHSHRVFPDMLSILRMTWPFVSTYASVVGARVVSFFSTNVMCAPRSDGWKSRPEAGTCCWRSAMRSPDWVSKVRTVAPPGPDRARTTGRD